MRGKISKLIRNVAKTDPYNVGKDKINAETKYGNSRRGNFKVLAPGFKLTVKYLKRFYKQGHFTSNDLRENLATAQMVVVEVDE